MEQNTQISRRTTGILAYCTIIGWLVAFFAGDRRARFHLNQGFVFHIIGLIINILQGAFGWITRWLTWPIYLVLGLASGAMVILCILGIVFAAQDREVPLPLGNLFTVIP